jgi:hypothetical protein
MPGIGRFAGHCIADHHCDKIEEIVGAKACTSETHLFLNGLKPIGMDQHLSKDCHFSLTSVGLRALILA